MINIEITDIQSLSSKDLFDLSEYLIKVAENKISLIPSEINPIRLKESKMAENLIDSSKLKEEIKSVKSLAESHRKEDMPIIKNDCAVLLEGIVEPLHDLKEEQPKIPPAPLPSAVFAKCPSPMGLIEEHLIPAPPEIVNIPQPPIVPHVELDSKGLPWDSRIHAKTKSKNKDGTWKGLRGTSTKVLDKVQNELKTVQELPPALSVPTPPDEPVKDFAAMMSLITSSITNKKIEPHHVNKVLNNFGIPSIPVVATRPDLIPQIMTALEEIINESV